LFAAYTRANDVDAEERSFDFEHVTLLIDTVDLHRSIHFATDRAFFATSYGVAFLHPEPEKSVSFGID
jgi:hypothetical protein